MKDSYDTKYQINLIVVLPIFFIILDEVWLGKKKILHY